MHKKAHRTLKKRLFYSPAMHWVLSLAVSLLLRLINLTCRVEKHIPSEAAAYMSGLHPAIFCFWHGRMIMHPFIKPKGRSMDVLISHHNDGALITATMRWFGIGSVRGSKKMGGTKALLALLDVIQQGGNISITPDGPRGPFQRAAQGAAFVAAKTGYPLLPVTFSASRHWRFNSWDKFMLPKPFARLVYVVGTPQQACNESDEALTEATAVLEQHLVAITHNADRQTGVAA